MKQLKIFVSLLFLSLWIFYSCTTFSPTKKVVTFVGTTVSVDGQFQLPIPSGWFPADSSSVAPLTFLLLKKDGSASISFTKVNLLPKSSVLSLEKIFKMERSMFLLERKDFRVMGKEKSGEFKNGEFVALKMKSKEAFARLVVIKFHNIFFESVLHCKNNLKENAVLQNILVSRLRKNF